MTHDPDVYSGSVCHLDMGFHKHGLFGPEMWTGVVLVAEFRVSRRPDGEWQAHPIPDEDASRGVGRMKPIDRIRAMTVDDPGPVIAFSGSRKFTERLIVEEVMRRLVMRWPHCIIRVGDAKRGLDPMAAKEATRWGKWPDVQECWWPPHPSTRQQRWEAAHERNGRVVQDAALLIAFYAPGAKSPGTTDAIKQARERGIPVYVYQRGKWTLPTESRPAA